MDWDSDPELRKIKQEFVESFRERIQVLEGIVGAGGSLAPEGFKDLRFHAHKLAGAAESYGFATITAISSAIEEYLVEHDAQADGKICWSGRELLLEALKAALSDSKDPVALKSDARLKQLISAV